MVKYAEVVVNAPVRYRRVMPDDAYPEERDTLTGYSPLGLTFHYSIPPRLEAEISLGQLVWIPFGRHRLQGVVMAFDDQSPVAETKDIYSIVDPEPVLSPPQIELARWISRYYHAPLIDTVLMMVPPGVDRKVEVFVELSPDVDIPENLTSRQRAIVEFLRGRSKMRLSVLGRSVGRKGWRSAVDQLVRKGLVCKWSELEEPRVKPKTERFVELVAGEGAIEEKLPHLGHSSKQADLLQILAHHRDPLPSVQDLCRMADCTEAPLRSLQEKGMVEITGRRHLVASLVPSQTIDQVINDQLSNAPMQAATMTYLQDQAAPVEATRLYEEVGTSSAVLRTLEKKGLLQRFEEEPQVLLTLPPEELPAQLISLRGAEKHVMVLKLLRECGGALEVGEVCAQVECSPGLIKELEDQGLVRVEEHEVWRDPLEGRTFASTKPPRLTPDQEAAYKAISAALDGDRIPSSRIFLLHGVTGSGKTEIYLRMLADVLEKGRQAIVLVPEIALTPQTIRRFAARFPGHIAVLHSKLSLGERYDEWRRIRMGKVDVVIGSRSAIFAPLPRLGLIVLDEEHEWTYKQESTPRYHAHHVAIKLAELTGAVVILGSATPDVISYYRARRGEYQLLHLPQRIMGHRRQIEEQRARFQIPDSGLRVREVGPEYEDARYMDLPPVQIVDLRQELRAGNTSIFSRALQDAMTVALAAGEQVILFLNRRGTATFIQCRDCGFVLKCQRCDIPLTYHGAADDLVCHHCNRRTFVPSQCPSCWSGRIKFFGIGTQKVEQV
ncbi:MAG: primosomal protein N', partial [Anaerolineae bacterium]